MTEPPPSGERSRSKIGACLCIFGKCIACQQVHACAHCLWQVAKGIVILVFFLWAFGLPGGWVAEQLRPYLKPYDITIQRVTWSPLRGLIIHNPKITERKLGSMPVFTADSLFIRPTYKALFKNKWQTQNIGVKNGCLLLPVCHTNSGIAIIDYMDLHDIEGKIDYDGQHTKVDVTATSDIGTHCLITGTFKQPLESEKKDTASWIAQLHRAHASLYTTPHWIVNVRERINEMTFNEPPKLVIAFQSDPANPKVSSGNLSFSSGSFQYHGIAYDHIFVDIALKGNTYDIERTRLERGAHAFTLTGNYARTNDVFDAHVRNDLPMDTVSVFFPDAWQQKMTKAGLQFSGALHSEAWVGPCSLRNAPQNWSGWISIQDAAANELVIDRAFASVKRDARTLTIDDGIIEGGKGIGAGSITFNTRTDIPSQTTSGDIDLGIDLEQLYTFLPKGLKKFSRELEIWKQPARFTGTFSIPHTNTKASVISGAASGTDLSYRGVFVSDCNTEVRYDRSILELDSFRANCQTGAVEGVLVMDLSNHVYGVDIAITADPGRIGPVVGTNFTSQIKSYAFSDDILVLLNGVIHSREMADTDLQVYISGVNIGRTNWIADHLQASGNLVTNHLAITNFSATAFGGSVTGVVGITFDQPKTNVYVSGSATNISIDRLVKHMRPSYTNQYEGYLDGHLQIAGPFPDRPGRRNISGSGAFQIRDGRLMRIPVFGGLSSLLSKLYPGLGFVEQNQLTADFTISEGAFRTKNLKLLGSVMSLSAKGKYGFNDVLDFNIQVKPLRKGIIASTVRIVTSPLTKLLEFKVSGSIKDPKWEAANIPLL